jgi:hypothetical protein
MAYAMKKLACDPARIKGMSEKLIVSHYENNCLPVISGASIAGALNSLRWVKPRVAAPGGCC